MEALKHPLRAALAGTGISMVQLAELTGIPRTTLIYPVLSEANQDRVLEALRGKGFQVSRESLWGSKRPDTRKNGIRLGLGAVLEEADMSLSALAEETGIPRSTFYGWRRKRSRPSKTQRLAVESVLQSWGIVSTQGLWEERMENVVYLDQPKKTEDEMETISREYLTAEELEYWNLTADPFEDSPNPEDIWLGTAQARAEKALLAAIDRQSMVALVGVPGAGKTTLVRRLYGRMTKSMRVKLLAPASLNRKKITAVTLAVAILRDLLGKDTSTMSMEQRSELLRTTLDELARSGQKPVLVIDEAHLLPNDAFLAIKQIWDAHLMTKQLGVILVGQLPLKGRLKQDPGLREVGGRMQIVELGTGMDVNAYLGWRFARVNAKLGDVFDAGACKALGARGEHPLWINNLAVLAMRAAQLTGAEKVTTADVGRV